MLLQPFRRLAPLLLPALCLVPGPAAAGLDPAARAAATGDLDAALGALRTAFETGFPTPADVYADPRFGALREDAAAREAWRDLMHRHVRESRIAIVPPGEPGPAMLIRGRVVHAADGAPIADAVIYLYHTDDTGNYAPDLRVGLGSNPRLFGYVRSDADGRFEVRTIKPRAYPGSGPQAAHVHYVIEAAGRRQGDEFRPYTAPDDAAARRARGDFGRPFSIVREEDGILVCEVSLPVG